MGGQAADNVMGMQNERKQQREGLNSGILCVMTKVERDLNSQLSTILSLCHLEGTTSKQCPEENFIMLQK
jgi:hypothetical protein